MPPIARRNPVNNCPLTAAWAAVGGKWKLTIIYWLAERPRHFAALPRRPRPRTPDAAHFQGDSRVRVWPTERRYRIEKCRI